MSHVLVWFRRDLRLADNPALTAAIESGLTPIPVYIHDEPPGQWSPGRASAWWLHHSLVALQQSLRELGSDLLVFQGEARNIIQRLVQDHQCVAVYWNRCYEPDAIRRDKDIKKKLQEQDIDCQSFNGSLLIEPWQHLKKDETPYRVFTPFWKSLSARLSSFKSRPPPERMPATPAPVATDALPIDALGLLPKIDWDSGIRDSWEPGEAGACAQLERFVEEIMHDYPNSRDIPGKLGTSRMSPYLHFGEISPHQVWNVVQQVMQQDHSTGVIKGGESFLREVGWREFSYHLLYHFPQTPDQPLDQRFEGFPWRDDYAEDLGRWQRGQTGLPVVDAGMRELWTTGWMHNRVRMIVASLLTKNLLIPWQEGARWFWDTLVDADLANNTQGWQWTAGCGADAAPYFRIFNPVLQGERFDPDGRYVRRWVPELKDLPNKWIHKPWEAPESVLAEAGVLLNKDYPESIVDLSATRKRALERWDQVKKRE